MLKHSKIDNIMFDDVHHWDAPDYVDAYITSADYDGKEMTEAELDEINEDSDFVHEKLQDHLH